MVFPSDEAGCTQHAMRPEDERLIWLDLEMTGLDPDNDRILEVALVVTDRDLAVVAEAPVWAVHQSDARLAAMDEWNQRTHGQSGLVDRVRASAFDEATVETEALAFLARYCPSGKSPMCGNSIGQDRRFLFRYMPRLEKWFHYRNLDVSTLKELCRRWNPTLAARFAKEERHQALADVYDSIDELRFYRDHFLKLE